MAKVLREAQSPEGERDADATILEPRTKSGGDSGSTQATEATGRGTILGTPGYMSPEQARGETEKLDQGSDIYSLGAVLLFLATGSPEASLPQSQGLDKSLAAICAKATAENPAARYGNASDLAADVSRYLDGLPVSARKESVLDKLGRFYRRYNVAILLIAAYLLMRVLVLLFFRR